MNSLFKYIITQTVKKRLKKNKYKSVRFEQIFLNVKVEINHIFRDSFFILLGVLSAGFGLKGFLLPNMFLDGGAMGISLIIAEISIIPLSILIVAINLPFLIMGRYSISRQFAVRSIIAIILLAVVVHFIPFPLVTEDKLLIAVFGGFFLGLGIGLAIRGGSVIDGTEVLAIFISRRTSMSIGDVILVFNVFIFGIAAYVFSIEVSLYAMLTYLAASKTVDFVVSGIEEYVGVTIISEKSEEIRKAILEKMGRGCTVYYGKKGHSSEDTEILYTLITRLELAKLHTETDKIDKNAFIVMHSIKDAKGGMIKKRALK
ncbi:MAG: YitT family protein [Chlorobi bacterium]|nr:YitT family protein [Chlorobiota bacterium]